MVFAFARVGDRRQAAVQGRPESDEHRCRDSPTTPRGDTWQAACAHGEGAVLVVVGGEIDRFGRLGQSLFRPVCDALGGIEQHQFTARLPHWCTPCAIRPSKGLTDGVTHGVLEPSDDIRRASIAPIGA